VIAAVAPAPPPTPARGGVPAGEAPSGDAFAQLLAQASDTGEAPKDAPAIDPPADPAALAPATLATVDALAVSFAPPMPVATQPIPQAALAPADPTRLVVPAQAGTPLPPPAQDASRIPARVSTTQEEEAAVPDASGPTTAAKLPDAAPPAFEAVRQAIASPALPTSGPASPAPALAEMALTHHLDLARDGAWLDRLAHDIAASAGASDHLRFSLAPEHLGRLEVALAQTAGGTAIRLTTETEQAHRIVAEAQPMLVAEARAQGLTVSETSVDLAGRGGAGGQGQAFGNQSNGKEGHRPPAWRPLPTPAAPTPEAGSDELFA